MSSCLHTLHICLTYKFVPNLNLNATYRKPKQRIQKVNSSLLATVIFRRKLYCATNSLYNVFTKNARLHCVNSKNVWSLKWINPPPPHTHTQTPLQIHVSLTMFIFLASITKVHFKENYFLLFTCLTWALSVFSVDIWN